MITAPQDMGSGDTLHPLMTGPFSEALKWVQVIDNEIKIFELGDIEITGKIVREGS